MRCSRSPRIHSMAPSPELLLAVQLAALLLPFPRWASADPDDEACLSNLRRSLTDPSNSLRNWSRAAFAAPCDGFTSHLEGVTCNNGRVYKLTLAGLALGGSVSPFVSNCTNLQWLDLSSNQLGGGIPPEISALLNLAVLNLSVNLLTGPIPPELALCSYLNVVDLHSNQLSGGIPEGLGLLVRLSAFDVSYNRLEGPIPPSLANRTGTLPRFNASSFTGNKGLYGYPLPLAKGRGVSVIAIVGIGLGSGLISLVLSFTIVCVWLRLRKQPSVDGE
ncbi:receptor-like protein 57 [Curcuma longa]|uniref:receptor-like protein 57 n=1 Tax=Curcuma longa TaxID=136217 RepID=UPI003D9ED351